MIPPLVRAIIEKKAFPSERRTLFKTNEAHISGAPQKIKRPYSCAYGNTDSEAPTRLKNCLEKIFPKIVISAPTPSAVKSAVEAIMLASSFLFWPSLMETRLPEPIPSVKPQACIIDIIGKTIPTAALACVLICETKKVSAIL